MTIEEKRFKLAQHAFSQTQGQEWSLVQALADYFRDLNAVHELEGAGLNGSQYDAFVFHLLEIARRDGAPACESDLVCCARATAAQRCEALGLTLNLWK